MAEQKTAEIFDLQGNHTGKNQSSHSVLYTTKTRRYQTCSLSYPIQQNPTSRQRPNGWKKNQLQNHEEQAAQPQEFPASKAAAEEQHLHQAQLKADSHIHHAQKRKSCKASLRKKQNSDYCLQLQLLPKKKQ